MNANFKPDYRPNVKCQIKFLKLILPYFTMITEKNNQT